MGMCQQSLKRWKISGSTALSVLAIGLTFGAAESYAAPDFYSTSDPSHWQVTANASGVDNDVSKFLTTGFAPAVAIAGRTDWIANNSTGSNACCVGGWTQFVFRQTFDLAGYDPATANLSFRWGGDDSGEVFAARGSWTPKFRLNGGSLVDGTAGYYQLGNPITLTGGFVSGINTLDFYVQGNGITDGFVLQTQSFTAAPVPEPETYGMLVAGLGLIATVARRKKY